MTSLAGGGASKFSRLRGGLRIGSGYFASRGLLGPSAPPPKGLVDTMADLGNPRVDVARVHPDVARFFVDTASLELRIVSHWRFPFSLAWYLFRPLLAWIGQLVLPLREARILTQVTALDRARDGRANARAVIREYADTGRVMQVVAYATSTEGETRFMNAAFPLPGGHLTGILRLDVVGEGEDGLLAVGVSSRARERDGAGIWYVIGGVAIPVPFEERLDLWAPSMTCAPITTRAGDFPGTIIVGRHEQRLLGLRLVTHEYWFRPRAPGAS
ncbi:MAG: hypothetical protein JST00_25735 [Deltaproteobacteria bacterium]|nr:hypothetical protein [Deltaproteobacteria bacterium]